MVTSGTIYGGDYWQQIIDYDIDIEFDPADHTIEGMEKIRYMNQSPDTLREIYFHLYPNAFKKGSVMDREARAASINLINSPLECGWLKLNPLSVKNLSSTPNPIEYHVSYNSDSTLVKFQINPPVVPGEEIEFTFHFSVKIRKFNVQYDKSGYRDKLYEISQWYPKVCVYDKYGWDAHPNHFLGEFYGEFGTYKVSITLPDSFIVAATGEVMSGDPGWQEVSVDTLSEQQALALSPDKLPRGKRKVTFYAEKVHDFVWSTSPNYLYESGKWNGISVHVLYEKSRFQKWHKNTVNAALHALEWLEKKIGRFPYSQITVAQGLTDGGMEYPMMTVLGYFDFSLVFHEICHSYFYAAVANNEHKDGWLDEGLVTYLTDLFVTDKFGKSDPSLQPSLISRLFTKPFKDYSKYSMVKLNSLYYYFYSGFEVPLGTECYLLNNLYLYNYHVYIKPTQFFAILDYLVGREKFFEILQNYYQKWKFKHVDYKSLQQVCEAIYGSSLDWLFNDWIHKTPKVDYACTKVNSQRQANGVWKTDVYVKRLGDGIIPVEVQLITAGNDTVIKRWDGIQKQTTLTFLTKDRMKNVWLDPRDIILDQNRFNNGSPKFRLFCYPEFPSMYYIPRDRYSIFYWPQIWYNDIDGVKAGLKFFGSFLNRYYIMRNYLWYNVRTKRFDYCFGYTMPWETIDRNLWRHLNILSNEGRFAINANLQYNIVNSFAQKPIHNLRIGILHSELRDDRFGYRKIKIGDEVIKLQTWEKGNLTKFYFNYQYNYQLSPRVFTLNFSGNIGDKRWGSDFDYYRFSLDYQYEIIGVIKSVRLKFRNFIGFSSARDKMPIQDQFWIAEANPMKRFKYFYLRSPGSIPVWLNYHLPGDGNLRGYTQKFLRGNLPLTCDKIAAVNFEGSIRNFHRAFPKAIRKWVMGMDLVLFVDGAYVPIDELSNKFLLDGGIGVNFYKIILGKQRKLRVHFPLWLNQPNLNNSSSNEPSWKFRWVVSFQ